MQDDIESKAGFDPALVRIERHRFSVTQGEATLYYQGKKLARFGDDIELQLDGEWRGYPDSFWVWIARCKVEEMQEKARAREQVG